MQKSIPVPSVYSAPPMYQAFASALESQQYTSFCPQQVGRLAGKTNMPADDQQIIFKYYKKKKKKEVEPG